jgi:hypothetical protein
MESSNDNKTIEPWKFQPGNPGGGRKAMPEKYKELFRGKLTDLSIKVLESVLDGSDEDAKVSDRVRCVEIALDRAWGKPVQAVDLSGEDGENPLASIKIEFVKSPKQENDM